MRGGGGIANGNTLALCGQLMALGKESITFGQVPLHAESNLG